MSEKTLPMKKMVPIVVITWILSLVTTLALVYFAPNIFPPINTANISDKAIVADKLADGAIITTKLADGAITSAKILDGTLTAIDIADGSIITVKVADSAVTTAKIANDAVTDAKIADDAIVTTKLADGSVTSAKILNGTVLAEDLATGSVTTLKISDGAVTTAKIADYAVTSLKLAPNAIPFAFTSITTETSTTSTTFVEMLDTSVYIDVNRQSHLLILLSLEVGMDTTTEAIGLQAFVGTNTAVPDQYSLAPTSTTWYDTHTCSFYMPSVTASSWKIHIRWFVTGGTGWAYYRTLTVIALPA